MCSIAIIKNLNKEFPLIIAGNRDESVKRPSLPVQILATKPHLIVGGKDELKGGSWLAVNKHSLFVAITNQGVANPKLETRGKIVMDALNCSSIKELLSFVEKINPTVYNDFNIIFGNQKHMYVGHSYILPSMVIKELPSGVSIFTENIKFGTINPKAHYIHNLLDDEKDMPWLEYYKVLKRILRNTEYGIKVKPKKNDDGKFAGHCTRSSSILAFSKDGLARYKFFDRTAKKPKSENDEYVPRFNDYIDLWRGSSSNTPNEEDIDDLKEGDDIVLKDKISDIKFKLKSLTKKNK